MMKLEVVFETSPRQFLCCKYPGSSLQRFQKKLVQPTFSIVFKVLSVFCEHQVKFDAVSFLPFSKCVSIVST